MNPIIEFYALRQPDDQGRWLDRIIGMDDTWWESQHDFIQWLFPNVLPSSVHRTAPVINVETRVMFRGNEELRLNLLLSWMRFLRFLGLRWHESRVIPDDNWEERRGAWFTKETHNCLRITRVLLCLRELGMEREAQQFLDGLVELVHTQPDCAILPTTLEYWS